MSLVHAARIRVLVVDDSAFNRRVIADALSLDPEFEVVGRAGDGEEALKQALLLKPDVISLDLEMPKMDGFSFLRLLMARMPIPVIVFSSYAQRENILKALELGALDFVPKPERLGPEHGGHVQELIEKLRLARSVRPSLIGRNSMRRTSGAWASSETPGDGVEVASSPAQTLVAIASSTGGPTALLAVFARLERTSRAAFIIAQHMPDKFTRTFADRLARQGGVSVSEAQEGDRLVAASGFVCPGRHCVDLGDLSKRPHFTLRVLQPSSDDRYVPSGDRLFRSVAEAGMPAVGVVLSGMGDDGLQGAKAMRDAGGMVICESEETAAVAGMPQAVVRAGLASHVWPLPEIADYLATL
jgi:two-component system chemotaxis response regulator CheB